MASQTYEKTLHLTREKKLQKLTLEGHSNKFVDNVDIYECPFCFMITRDALQSSVCGHSFCTTCWGDWTIASGDTVCCPIDNEPVESSQVFKDKKQDRDIRGLRVYCDNEEFGCEATPEFRDLEKHMAACKYRTVLCELECEQKVLASSLDHHLTHECVMRIVPCDTCGTAVRSCDLEKHKETCPLKIVTCDYCMVQGLLYKDLNHHWLTDCTKYHTHCSFALFGCSDKLARESLPPHHQTNYHRHLGLLNSSLTNLYSLVGATPGLTREGTPLDDTYELPAALYEKVGKCDAKTMAFWLDLPGSNGDSQNVKSLAEKMEIMEQDNQQLKERVETLVEEKVQINHEMDTLKDEIVQLKLVNDEQKMMFDKFVDDTNKKFDELNKEVVKVDENAPTEIKEGIDSVCPCFWRVSVVRNMYRKVSPTFYTQDGYRMRIEADRLHVAGFRCILLKGKNDDQLKWPWNGTETMTVKNTDTGECIDGTFVVRDVGYRGRDKPTSAQTNGYSVFNYQCELPHIETLVDVIVKK